VADGDKDDVAAAHRDLVRCLDRAAASRAMHPNRAARKKSQAARLIAGTS
jgi:ribosomal protein S20